MTYVSQEITNLISQLRDRCKLFSFYVEYEEFAVQVEFEPYTLVVTVLETDVKSTTRTLTDSLGYQLKPEQIKEWLITFLFVEV